MGYFWALADTHVSFGKPKDMARFGERWTNHAERIAAAWRTQIAPDDVVLVAGDLSWAGKPGKVEADLAWLAALPGRKVIVRGNHDHWWRTIDEVRQLVTPLGLIALEGDCIVIDDVLVCGTMGYISPSDPYYDPELPKDSERYARELGRLTSALDCAAAQRTPGQRLIVMLHYPPFTSQGQPTAFVEAISRAAPTLCVYGHLHRSAEWQVAVNTIYQGVEYRLVAADFVQMTPQRLFDSPFDPKDTAHGIGLLPHST